MKILRYLDDTGIHYGVWEREGVLPLAGSPFEGLQFSHESSLPLETLRLLSPVQPSKILAIGFNYRDHARELGREIPTEPNVFQKALSSLTGPGDAIERPACMTKRVEYEGELAVVIGKKAKHLTMENALDAVLGYTCANDVSARDLQTKFNQWTICKGFDTFCPLGPWIETDVDPSDLKIETRVNGVIRQSSSTKELIFNVPQLLCHLSAGMTLLPGDVILTGTPYGVGEIQDGDTVEIEIQGIGILRNPVKNEIL